MDLGGVLGRLVREELGSCEAAVLGGSVLREQVEGCKVEEDEVAGAVGIKAGYLGVDAVDVIGDGLAGGLAVSQKGAVAEVVGADPDGVYGAVGLSCEES